MGLADISYSDSRSLGPSLHQVLAYVEVYQDRVRGLFLPPPGGERRFRHSTLISMGIISTKLAYKEFTRFALLQDDCGISDVE